MTHPRLSVSQACSLKQSWDDDLALWAALDVDRVGLLWRKMAAIGAKAAVKSVRSEGLEVTNVIATGILAPADELAWDEQRERLLQICDVTAALECPVLVFTPGELGPLHWEAAADALAELLRPVIPEAAARGVTLALEHTNSLRLDLSFVTSFRQAAALAVRMGCAAALEVNAAWHEQGLSASIEFGGGHLGLVQVSDFILGTTRTPDRAVPGDGDIPIERILREVLATGYEGAIDLEIVGPRIEREGYEAAIGRGLEVVTTMLDALDA